MDQIVQEKLRKSIRYGRLIEFKTILSQSKDTDPINVIDAQGYNSNIFILVIHEIAYTPASDPIQIEFYRELYNFYVEKFQNDQQSAKSVFQRSLTVQSFRDKRSPVHIAAEHDRRQLLKRFIELGISIYTKDNIGFTPLHLGASSGHYILITIILDAEQRNLTQTHDKLDDILNSRDKQGRTALHIAAKQAQETNSLILIPRYQNVDLQDDEGNTPLHYATQAQNVRIMRALLLRGASRQIKNKQNMTA